MVCRFQGSVCVLAEYAETSFMDPLKVIVGSKVILSPLSTAAVLFFSFHLWVRVSSSFFGWRYMLYLSAVRPVMSWAREAHR